MGVPESDAVLGRLLVEQRLVRAEHVEECLAEIVRAGEGAPRLGDLLVRRGYLAPAAYASTVSGARPSGPPTELPPEVAKSAPSERFGRYVRVDRLGAGGMGDVWRAYDTDLHRWVALKFLKADDPDDLARFQREAQVAARLSHPNIAAVYEVGEAQGRHFIAMQLVRGRTLKAYAKRPVREVVELVRDAARAVAAASAQGVVHRDLKPDNIMVEESPRRVYVMDFGLARQVHGAAHSASGLLIGTPAYMSPEQARGQRADERADVYALGATLYDLLCGRVPFDGTSVIDILMRVVHEDPKPLRAQSPRLDRDIETIVMKCLEKERERRYAGAAELADDLDRWLAGEPISARPASVAYRWRKRLAKRKALVAVSGAALLVAGALLGLWIGARRSAAAAQAEALELLRHSTQSSLEAAMAMRRVGRLDDMREYAGRTEAACRAAAERFPRSPEPHYLHGRMVRALEQYDEALAAQNQALALDPSHAGARAERGLLRVWAYETRLERLRLEWRRQRAEMGVADLREPARPALEDAEARRLKEGAAADLAAARDPVSAALVAWLRDDPTAAALFESASRAAPLREETWEWLGRLARDGRRFEEAVAWFSRGLEHDQGYLRHRTGRVEARIEWAVDLSGRGEDPSAVMAAALADADEMVRLHPSREASWINRGGARASAGSMAAVRGDDPSELMRGAIADYQEAIRLVGTRALTWRNLAKARLSWAYYRVYRGEDPRPMYAEAANELDRAVALSPRDGETRITRGLARQTQAMYASRRGEDAKEMFQSAADDCAFALALDASNDQWWETSGSVRAAQAHHESTRGRDPAGLYEAAERDFAEALRLNPRRDQTWRRRGQMRMNRGDEAIDRGEPPEPYYRASVEDHDRAVELNGALAENRWSRGVARLRLVRSAMERGDDASTLLREAAEDFDEGVRRGPRLASTWSARGQARAYEGLVAMAAGRDGSAAFLKAVEDFSEALKIDAGDEGTWRMRGWARAAWAMQQLEAGAAPEALLAEALADFDRALALNPEYEEAYLSRGVARSNLATARARRREDPAEACARATEDFDRALRVNPRRDETWMRRGQVRVILATHEIRLGRDPWPVLRGAVADYDEAIKRNPLRAETWSERGCAHGLRVLYWAAVSRPPRRNTDPEVKEHYESAVRDLTEALRLNPRLADGYSRRGTYHYLVRAWRAAAADLEEAVRLKPSLEGQLRSVIVECRKQMGE